MLNLVNRNILGLDVDVITRTAISTGIYRLPIEISAKVAISGIQEEVGRNPIGVFVTLNEASKYQVYQQLLKNEG